MRLPHIIILILFSIYSLSGCQQGNTKINTSKPLVNDEEIISIYKNEDYNLRILKHSTWQVDSESISDTLNIQLSHSNHLNAIVTTVSEQTTLSMIKSDLLAGAGEIKNFSEGSNRFSYESTLSEAIHTEVYLKKRLNYPHLLIVVMTPVKDYEKNKSYIEELIKHVQ